MKKSVFLLIVIFLCSFVSFAQTSQNRNFPRGSTDGTTERNMDIRGIDIPNVDIRITRPESGGEVAFSLQVLLLLTILAPSILILTTCFLRFSIVLDFIKRALSLQQVPPTSVLNGIALFMTLFVMWPVFSQIYTKSFKPLGEGQISIEQAYREAEKPLKTFMMSQMNTSTGIDYLGTFTSLAKIDKVETLNDIPLYVMIPSYILHELTVAFKIGIILYIPFIVIDMVVASILMSMGMMMLPPVQISMPFKLMLFVLVDGWGLLTQQLFASVMQNLGF